MNIKNKVVLITGASQGLGRALAIKLAELGARVVLVARGEKALYETVNKIKAHGGEAYGIVADVGNKDAIYAITGQAAAMTNSAVDILINNASTLGPTPLRLFLDTDCEDLEQVLQVNTVGAFRLIKAVAGPMVLRGHGLIINISSDAAVSAYPTWGIYSVAKAALDHLTRIFAAEVGERSVRSFAIDPGEMNTKMHADAIPEANPHDLQKPDDVALKIIDIIKNNERIENGSRLIAPQWEIGHGTSKMV